MFSVRSKARKMKEETEAALKLFTTDMPNYPEAEKQRIKLEVLNELLGEETDA